MIEGSVNFITSLPVTNVVFTVTLVLIIVLFIYNHLRKNKSAPNLRRIAGFERIKHLVDAAVESGRPIHLSLGQGAIGTPGVVDSSVGLTVLEYISARAAGLQHSDVTCGEATLLASTLGTVPGDEFHSSGGDDHADGIYFCGPDPLTYANGVVQHLRWSGSESNLFVGYAGAECLYIAGSPAARQIQQAGGASSPLAAALLHIATGEALVGEEFYAARAYLHRSADVKSLMIQDWLRYIILFAVIGGVILATIGYGS